MVSSRSESANSVGDGVAPPSNSDDTAALRLLNEISAFPITPPTVTETEGWGKESAQVAGMIAAGAAGALVWSFGSKFAAPCKLLGAGAASGAARAAVQGTLEYFLVAPEQRTSLTNQFCWGVVDGMSAVVAHSLDKRLALRHMSLIERGLLTGAAGTAAWSTPHSLYDHRNALGSGKEWLKVAAEVEHATIVGAAIGGAFGSAISAFKRYEPNIGIIPKSSDLSMRAHAKEFKFASGAITDLETPAQRAVRLGLAGDFDQSKDIFFARSANSDGIVSEIVVRRFDPNEAASLMRANRAQVDRQVNEVLSANTGLEMKSLRFAVRDGVTLPKLIKAVQAEPEVGMAFIQEHGGKQFGTQVKEWAALAAGRESSAEFVPGSIKRLMDSDPNAQRAVADVVFDNMWKGNLDLTELSQQTIPRGTVTPRDVFHTVTVDAKNDFTLLEKPTWGFASQYGMTLDVAKALEGKQLLAMSPALQQRAETLSNALATTSVREQLIQAGLTNSEIDAAASRLLSLRENGFPKHLGEMTFTDDAGNVTASLTSLYDDEAAAARAYLLRRDGNLKIVRDGDFVSLQPNDGP